MRISQFSAKFANNFLSQRNLDLSEQLLHTTLQYLLLPKVCRVPPVSLSTESLVNVHRVNSMTNGPRSPSGHSANIRPIAAFGHHSLSGALGGIGGVAHLKLLELACKAVVQNHIYWELLLFFFFADFYINHHLSGLTTQICPSSFTTGEGH